MSQLQQIEQEYRKLRRRGISPKEAIRIITEGVKPPRPPRDVSRLETATTQFIQGASAGFFDELMGGLAAAFWPAQAPSLGESPGERFRTMRDLSRSTARRAAAANPGTAAAARGIGALATTGPLMGLAGTVKGAAGLGAAVGGATAAGESEAESLKGVATDALQGAVVGGAAGGIGASVVKIAKAIDTPRRALHAFREISKRKPEAAQAVREAVLTEKLSDRFLRASLVGNARAQQAVAQSTRLRQAAQSNPQLSRELARGANRAAGSDDAARTLSELSRAYRKAAPILRATMEGDAKSKLAVGEIGELLTKAAKRPGIAEAIRTGRVVAAATNPGKAAAVAMVSKIVRQSGALERALSHPVGLDAFRQALRVAVADQTLSRKAIGALGATFTRIGIDMSGVAEQ